MPNYIVNLLHLKDQNIKIDENSEFTEELKVNGATYVVIPATLTDAPCACEKCGAVNDSHQVVKRMVSTSLPSSRLDALQTGLLT